MFSNLGWPEMLVVAVVAIIFIGPKELPGMLRTFGRAIRRVRGMAGEFQQQFDDALRDAELDGVKDGLNDLRNLDPAKQIKDKFNPLKSEMESIQKDLDIDNDYDPEELFDESKAPDAPDPVEIDVEAALDRQDAINAAKARGDTTISSGNNAVPGFATDAKPVKPATKPKAKPKSTTTRKPAAKRKAVASKSKTAKASGGGTKPRSKTSARKKASEKAGA